MNTQEYEARIQCLEYENQLLGKSREKGWMLVGELESKNERLEKENADLLKEVGEHYSERLILERKIRRMGGDISNATPKYYAQMSITKCV